MFDDVQENLSELREKIEMDRIIKMQTELGSEIRSRAAIEKIKVFIQKKRKIYLDMTGVTFISRSCADELYNIQLDYKHVKIKNQTGEVYKMMRVVEKGRTKRRNREILDSSVQDMKNVKLFEDFLQTI